MLGLLCQTLARATNSPAGPRGFKILRYDAFRGTTLARNPISCLSYRLLKGAVQSSWSVLIEHLHFDQEHNRNFCRSLLPFQKETQLPEFLEQHAVMTLVYCSIKQLQAIYAQDS